jgi:hypothetical protein
MKPDGEDSQAYQMARTSIWISLLALAIAGSELLWHIIGELT